MSWCWWCKRAVRYDEDYREVLVNGEREVVCPSCWEKSDPPVPLDMTREEADAGR